MRLTSCALHLTENGVIQMESGVFDDVLIKHLWSTDSCRDIQRPQRVQKWYAYERRSRWSRVRSASIRGGLRKTSPAIASVDQVDIEGVRRDCSHQASRSCGIDGPSSSCASPSTCEYIHFGPTTQYVPTPRRSCR